MSMTNPEWIDKYWELVDVGNSYAAALVSVCLHYGLSSYEEDELKDAVQGK